MPEPVNMNDVIEDSVSDAQADLETPEVETLETSETPESETPETADADTPEAEEGAEVESPAAKASDAVEDEFAKKHGLQPQQVGERENRLPYSRVKKIVENAEKKAIAPLQAKLAEYEPLVQEHTRLKAETQKFEQFMLTEPLKFLDALGQIPAYQQIFAAMSDALNKAQGSAEKPVEVDPLAGMPQPDQKLSDGSMVYSLEGLAKRDAWNREQAKKEVLGEVQKQFGPLLDERAASQRLQALYPQVQRQIEEARQWDGFTDNEAEITKVLQQNPQISLERAYQIVVFPKFKADRAAIEAESRKKVLAELKKAPKATSVSSGASRPAQGGTPTSGKLEDIIAAQLDGLPGR